MTGPSREGSTLGDWCVGALLGIGGVATVYEARDRGGDTPVAIKVLHPEMAEVPELRLRFLRESRVANTIPHRGVARVLEHGETPDGCPFLVMELLVGESYEQRWERKGRRLPIAEALWMADQTLDVLHAAHKKGVVHRDIKPDNVFLTHDRRVVVLDFGIAGLAELAGSSEATRVGVVMGTPAFMPPEQARGDWTHVGIQTDLWAVGATLFTLLSGRPVHDERVMIDQLTAAVSRPAPSLAEVAPGTPEPVVNLVDFALRFDHSARWPNARAMQVALRAAYSDWRRNAHDGPIPDDEVDITDGVLRLEKPEPPPMSRR
ncbi:MAG: serine/threonine protein kinase [Polyangiaceae bacterium]|nr:serine/threonine protein kinase [Polyangiaceae bacterium]